MASTAPCGASPAWTGNINLGSPLDGWVPVQENRCGTTVQVQPENDVTICNGQSVEATNDDATVTSLAMYPKQPFDIAGRTGTVVFDVSNNSQGTHAAWPEFWYTDQPVPAPFVHEEPGRVHLATGWGYGSARSARPARAPTAAPPARAPTRGPSSSVDSAVVVRNYESYDSFMGTEWQPDGQAP